MGNRRTRSMLNVNPHITLSRTRHHPPLNKHGVPLDNQLGTDTTRIRTMTNQRRHTRNTGRLSPIQAPRHRINNRGLPSTIATHNRRDPLGRRCHHNVLMATKIKQLHTSQQHLSPPASFPCPIRCTHEPLSSPLRDPTRQCYATDTARSTHRNCSPHR